MTFIKTFSTLSLALALQAGALVAAAVVLSPSDAAAATHFSGGPQHPTDQNSGNKKGGKREKTHADPFIPPSTKIGPGNKIPTSCRNCN